MDDDSQRIKVRSVVAQGGRYEIMGSPAVLLASEPREILESLTQTPEVILAEKAIDIVHKATDAKLELWNGLLAGQNVKPPTEFDAATSIEVIRTFIRHEIARRDRDHASTQQTHHSHITGLYGVVCAILGAAENAEQLRSRIAPAQMPTELIG